MAIERALALNRPGETETMLFGDEQIRRAEITAAGAAHSGRLPGVEDLDVRCGRQHQAQLGRFTARHWPISLKHDAPGHYHIGMVDSRSERPLAIDAVSACDAIRAPGRD